MKLIKFRDGLYGVRRAGYYWRRMLLGKWPWVWEYLILVEYSRPDARDPLGQNPTVLPAGTKNEPKWRPLTDSYEIRGNAANAIAAMVSAKSWYKKPDYTVVSRRDVQQLKNEIALMTLPTKVDTTDNVTTTTGRMSGPASTGQLVKKQSKLMFGSVPTLQGILQHWNSNPSPKYEPLDTDTLGNTRRKQ